MGTLLARSVVSKAQRIIQDADGIRWPFDEMLGWLNSGQREIALLRPDSCSATVKMQLAAGTQQRVPSTAWRLLRVIRNMGLSGDAPGRAIRFCEQEILDSQHPNWHAETPSAIVKNWTYDEVEPKTFYCYPPQPTGNGRGYIDMVVSKPPVDCTMKDVPNDVGQISTTDSEIGLDDVFEGPLIEYQIFRAHLKEAKYALSGKADAAYGRFMNSLGLKTASDKQAAIRRAAPPNVNPNVPGNGGLLGD